MSFLFSLFLFPSSSFLSSSSSPFPFSHFLHLDLNSPIPVPSQPPTHTSSKPSSATLAASSQHTHSPPPRSSAQKLTILGGCSCLRLIRLWGCLCLLLILIRKWACFIPFVFFHFFLCSVSHDGRGICSNSAHIVPVSVLIADEITFTQLLHYPLPTLHFSPCFSYSLSLILSRSIHRRVATRVPLGHVSIDSCSRLPTLSYPLSFSYPRWRWGGSGQRGTTSRWAM